MPSNFGAALIAHRQRNGLSQAALSDQSGVSQRHISFLESGRSRPGHSAIAKFVQAFGLSKPEADHFLTAAGILPLNPSMSWLAPEMAEVRSVTAMMLEKHEPFPAVICESCGTIVAQNAAFRTILALAGLSLASEALANNLYDLTLHPEGLMTIMLNPADVVPHTLHRLRHAAAGHEKAAATLDRVSRYPSTANSRFAVMKRPVSGTIIEHYRLGERILRIISATATFGSPEIDLARNIQVEIFLPADDATRSFFEASAS